MLDFINVIKYAVVTCVVGFFVVVPSAAHADKKLCYTMSDATASRIVDDINAMTEIPVDDEGNELYTRPQWAREYIRRRLLDLLRKLERQSAESLIYIDIPDHLVTVTEEQ